MGQLLPPLDDEPVDHIYRDWSTNEGEVHAQFLEFKDNHVLLGRDDGVVWKVHPTELSATDVEWYKKTLKRFGEERRRAENLRKYRVRQAIKSRYPNSQKKIVIPLRTDGILTWRQMPGGGWFYGTQNFAIGGPYFHPHHHYMHSYGHHPYAWRYYRH
jgi:hypothetical protein